MASADDLRVIAALARALTHRIRGDLGVVMSDLTYFGSLLTPDAVATSKKRCRDISDILSSLAMLRHERSKESIDMLEMCRILGSVEADIPAGSVVCDRMLLPFFRDTITLFFSGFSPSASLHGDSAPRSFISKNSLGYAVLWGTMPTAADAKTYETLTEFAEAELGEKFVIEAAVADLLVQSQSWRTRTTVSSDGDRRIFGIELSIPR